MIPIKSMPISCHQFPALEYMLLFIVTDLQDFHIFSSTELLALGSKGRIVAFLASQTPRNKIISFRYHCGSFFEPLFNARNSPVKYELIVKHMHSPISKTLGKHNPLPQTLLGK